MLFLDDDAFKKRVQVAILVEERSLHEDSQINTDTFGLRIRTLNNRKCARRF